MPKSSSQTQHDSKIQKIMGLLSEELPPMIKTVVRRPVVESDGLEKIDFVMFDRQ